MFFQSDSTIYTLVFQVVRLRWKPWFHEHEVSAHAQKAPAAAAQRPRRQRVGTTYGVHGEVLSKPPQGPKHTSHRAPKKTRKHKHLVLKWVLGIFAALIAAGIGLFAYMYITTEIPQPEKFALAEKTTVYYNDGTTPIGSYAEQNREIISCADLPDYVGDAIVASGRTAPSIPIRASIRSASHARSTTT